MLEVSQLRAGYGPNDVLQGISLDVAEGEIVTLIGANGAGKSTLLKVLSGLLPARAGMVKFINRDITRASPLKRLQQGIAQSPEGRRIFTNITVAENLRLGAYLYNDRQVAEDIEKVMEIFPILREKSGQMAGGLSGGQLQMLAIGRAMMSRPSLLLLDEPSLGLAPKLTRQVMQVVADLRTGGTSILLVEQNAMSALAIADRAYVMELGEIKLSGAADVIREDPAVREAYLGVA